MARRDMTKRQFHDAIERHDMRSTSLGYYSVGVGGLHVYARNGGDTRREQLAYLIAEQAKVHAKVEPQNAD